MTIPYSIGSNKVADCFGEVDSILDEKTLLNVIDECVLSSEIVFFHFLLQSEFSMGIPKHRFYGSFLLACTTGQLAHVKAFLQFGIDPNCVSCTDETGISSSAAWGNDAVILELINSGAMLRNFELDANEELSLIFRNCSPDTIRELLSIFKKEFSVHSFATIVDFANSAGRVDVADYLRKS